MKAEEEIEQIKKKLRNMTLVIEEMQKQISCGCEGHRFAVCEVEIDQNNNTGDPINYGFRCIICGIKYYKYITEMNDEEKKHIKEIIRK